MALLESSQSTSRSSHDPRSVAKQSGTIAVELERIVGLSSKFESPIAFHPTNKKYYIYSIASVIVVANKQNGHQRFLKSHNADISTLEISNCGTMVASGQYGCSTRKGVSKVNLWNFEQQSLIYTFDCLRGKVIQVSFTPDSKFLTAIDESGMFYLWDSFSFDIIVAQRMNYPITALVWLSVDNKTNSRHPTYALIVACGEQIYRWDLIYKINKMEYEINSTPFRFPTKGATRRNYTLLALDSNSDTKSFATQNGVLIAATDYCEICILDVTKCAFVSSFQCFKVNKKIASVLLWDTLMIIGSGDGSISCFDIRRDYQHPISQTSISGSVTSLQMLSDHTSVLITNDDSSAYKMDTKDLKVTPFIEAHSQPIQYLCFGSDSHYFATLTVNGTLTLWDLANYQILAQSTTAQKACCFKFTSNDELICGYENGSISLWDWKSSPKQMRPMWTIGNAHRGSVRGLDILDTVLLSGGDDGMLRLWNLANRKTLAQFCLLTGPVYDLITDGCYNEMVHICGKSRELVTFSLKRESVIIRRMLKKENFTSMCQRRHGDFEIVTTTSDGRVIIWDSELSDALHTIVCNSEHTLETCAVSPDGTMVAVGGSNGFLTIFDWDKKQNRGMFEGHVGKIMSLQWTPDNKQIVSADSEGAMCIWNVYS